MKKLLSVIKGISRDQAEAPDDAKEAPTRTGIVGELDNAPAPPGGQQARPRQDINLPNVVPPANFDGDAIFNEALSNAEAKLMRERMGPQVDVNVMREKLRLQAEETALRQAIERAKINKGPYTSEMRDLEAKDLHDAMLAAQDQAHQPKDGTLLKVAPFDTWALVTDVLDHADLLNFRFVSREADAVALRKIKAEGLVMTEEKRPILRAAMDAFSLDTPLIRVTLRGQEFTDADLLLLPATIQVVTLQGTDGITANGLRNFATHAPGLRSLVYDGDCNFNEVESRELLNFRYLESIQLSGATIDDADLARIPVTARKVELFRARGVTPDGLRQLCNRLPGLRSFTAIGCNFGVDHARAIAGFTRLTALNLSGNALTDEGVRVLSGLQLTFLSVGQNGLTWRSAEILKHNTTITGLDVAENTLGDTGAQHLLEMTNLRSLVAPGNSFGDFGAAVIANHPNLQAAELDSNDIGPAGARSLANGRIPNLSLALNDIGDEGAKALGGSTSIRRLDVEFCQLGDVAVTHLANSTSFVWLNVTNNVYGDLGQIALAGAEDRIPQLLFD